VKRAIRNIGQRGVLIAHETVKRAASQPKKLETSTIPLRLISMRAAARSGPVGENVALPPGNPA
jgi:hypothetical protein